jgi:hypothetical protein
MDKNEGSFPVTARGFSYNKKNKPRIPVVESMPAPAIRRTFRSTTRIQAALQKKIYGTSVVITDIVASVPKWLERKRRTPLVTHPVIRAFTGVPCRL